MERKDGRWSLECFFAPIRNRPLLVQRRRRLHSLPRVAARPPRLAACKSSCFNLGLERGAFVVGQLVLT